MKINICDTLKSKKSSAPISIVGTSIIIIDAVFSPGDLAFWVGVDSMDPKTSEYVFVNQIAKSLDQTGYELGEFEFVIPVRVAGDKPFADCHHIPAPCDDFEDAIESVFIFRDLENRFWVATSEYLQRNYEAQS